MRNAPKLVWTAAIWLCLLSLSACTQATAQSSSSLPMPPEMLEESQVEAEEDSLGQVKTLLADQTAKKERLEKEIGELESLINLVSSGEAQDASLAETYRVRLEETRQLLEETQLVIDRYTQLLQQLENPGYAVDPAEDPGLVTDPMSMQDSSQTSQDMAVP